MNAAMDYVQLAPQRVTPELYLAAKELLLQLDPDAAKLIEWSRSVKPPADPRKLASEIIWCILCAGRSAQAARTLERKVWEQLSAGASSYAAFGYRAKADAIDRAWREREADFAAYQKALAANDPEAFIAWCGSLPWIGDDTKYQLAKNCGFACPKPDVWVCRLAGIPDRPRLRVQLRFQACMAMCRALHDSTGDPVAVVDSVLWLASNKGVLQVDGGAGPIRLAKAPGRRGSIYAAESVEPDHGTLETQA